MPAPKGNKFAVGHDKNGPDKYTDEWIEKEAQAFLDWMEKPGNLFIKSFAVERGYHPNRLQEFAEKNNVFSGVYLRAKAWQEGKLVKGGLLREYDSGMTKFVLVNHHGYKEKAEISGDSTNPLAVVLEQIATQNAEPLNPI